MAQGKGNFTFNIKAEVKLPLCLTKYHAMKMHSLLDQAPCNEDK